MYWLITILGWLLCAYAVYNLEMDRIDFVEKNNYEEFSLTLRWALFLGPFALLLLGIIEFAMWSANKRFLPKNFTINPTKLLWRYLRKRRGYDSNE